MVCRQVMEIVDDLCVSLKQRALRLHADRQGTKVTGQRAPINPLSLAGIVTIIRQLFGNKGDVLSANAGNTAIETSLAR